MIDSGLHFWQLSRRWGQPCFLWWKYWATATTVILGTTIRILNLPVAILALRDTCRKVDAWPRRLFVLMMVLIGVLCLDFVFSLFKVHEVCTSDEILNWNTCAYQWGLNANFTEEFWVTPACCTDDTLPVEEYWPSACERDPYPRDEEFDASNCELISDIYDIGLGLLGIMTCVVFGRWVNSYRTMERGPVSTIELDETAEFADNGGNMLR